MSENEESLKVSKPSGDGVPVYRVALVRESTAVAAKPAAVRKSSDAAEVLRPLFAGLDREQFVVLMLDALLGLKDRRRNRKNGVSRRFGCVGYGAFTLTRPLIPPIRCAPLLVRWLPSR